MQAVKKIKEGQAEVCRAVKHRCWCMGWPDSTYHRMVLY
uniref:Uncharacterized protein n=1 Tax=Salmonella sp. TaxID=599 RepID=A0A482EUF0_SALSP|nr:hypothetical protein NNIBIDOC_00125 [Salmonella sp.]